MTLYLDVIWVLNYLIDYLLLLLTALVLKRRHSKIRFTFGAFVASLIVFLMFTPIGEWFYHPVTKLVYSALIVFVAFGYKRFTYYIQGLLMFYFVTFMTGGALFALHFFWQSELPISSEGLIPHASIGSPISWMLVAFGFPHQRLRLERMCFNFVYRYLSKKYYIYIQAHRLRTPGCPPIQLWYLPVCPCHVHK